MKDLTIIIPAFNEEARLKESVLEVLKAVEKHSLRYQILIIDDGSADDSYRVAKELALKYTGIEIHSNERNLGLGASYKNGLKLAIMSHVTWVPADCSHKADSLDEAFAAIGSADIIIPLPVNPEVRSMKRRIISWIYTKIINFTSGLDIPYYNGLSIHSAKLLRSIDIDSSGFGFQAEIIVKLVKHKQASYRVVSTTIEERNHGKSKAFTVKNLFSVWLVIAKIISVDKK